MIKKITYYLIISLLFLSCLSFQKAKSNSKNKYRLKGGLELKLILNVSFDSIHPDFRLDTIGIARKKWTNYI